MFRYEHPEFIDLLWVVPVLALMLVNYWFWRKRALARLGEHARVDRMIGGFSERRFGLKNSLLLLAVFLLIVAFANPQRGAKKQKMTQKSSDVFIALDISQSMWAQDVAPSRLELAKVFVQKLVQALEGERIGLIFFAGDAFLQMPLSTDYAFIIQSVQGAGPELITAQGTAIQDAIQLATKSYDSDPTGRALILITDGEDHDEGAVSQAETAFGDGIAIFPVGAGTPEGSPIPLPEQGGTTFKRDENNEVVRTKLDESMLHKIAQAGGGRAFNISQGDAAVSALKREIDGLEKRELELRSFSEFETYFQWFLLPALLLLLLDMWLGWKSGRELGVAQF